ncbi:cell division protein FtsZ [Hydrogenophaga sp. ZJX-1]|uniref:cell division protein FtsZ n=1 Tax=Hydrogenophaga sp. ZJX-1 TaxID=3404778 RepID=UPI003B27FCCE
MSTLQISLAIIGGLVLAGVVAYNAWVTSKSAPRTARERPGLDGAGEPHSFESPLTGPVIEPDQDGVPERIEPVMGHTFEAPREPQPQVAADGEARVPVVVPVTLSNVVSPPEKRPGLDALIDVITPLAIEGPVSGDALLAALPGTRRVGSKPFAVEGLNETSGEWESPRAGQRYHALQVGVQLANRAGALNDIEFSEFVVKAQAFADAVGAAPDFPDMRAEVARARELDAFASGHDAQLGFTLRARRSAWSPGYVAQNAARLGFVAGVLPGRMVLPASAAGQAPILSLAFDSQAAMAEDPEQSALREVALSLEVTHVPRSEQPFVRMRQAAAALAEAMEGVITDDGGQLLSTDTMDGIGADLESLYDALDSHDLSAGSPQARRLFS